MRVTKLELQGFKSFAKKTELNFCDGITAIIGPNGSGKSNLSDAIRWVLGEQSARNLRGGRMEDVIFGGTQKRKPLPMAEVTLTFDNEDHKLPTDYQEVAVTRRVYRSGESEYALNGKTCRLKDVLELFRDTGIGKDGYSIIGQGKVDEILSNRSSDRRTALEEAAGVMRYRVRREEAERKLEQTRKNMERIRDILTELEDRLGPLSRQSKKARQALEYQNELKELEVNLFLRETQRNREKLEKEQQNLKLVEENIAQNRLEDESLLTSLQKQEEALAAMDELLQQEQQALTELVSRLENRQGEKSLLKERWEHAVQEQERLLEQSREAEEKAEKLLNQVQELETLYGQDTTQLEAQLEKENEKLTALTLETEEAEEKIEKMKATIMESMNRLSDMRSSLSRFEAMESALKQREEAIEKEQEALTKKAEALALEHEEALAEEKNLLKNWEEAKAALQACKIRRQQGESTLRDKQKTLQQIEQNCAALASRLHVLKEMARRREGYQNSVRLLMEAGEKNPAIGQKIIGVVGELVRIPTELEAAMTTALGGAAQNIVAPTGQDGKALIEILRKREMGRATILPLDTLRINPPKGKDLDCLREKGVKGIASELIDCDPAARKAIDYLLGRTLVVEDMDTALRIRRQYNTSFQMVTVQGDILSTGGAMTGGSRKKESFSILSREREIEELGGQYKQAQQERDEATAAIAAVQKEQGLLAIQQDSLTEQVHEAALQVEKQKDKLSIIARDRENCREEQEALEEEHQSNVESLAEIEKSIQRFSREKDSLEQRSDVTREDVMEGQKAFYALRKRREEQGALVTDVRLKLTAAQKETDAREKEKARLNREQEEALAQSCQNALKAREQQTYADGLKEEEEALQEALERLEKEVEQAREQLEKKRSERRGCQEELSVVRTRRDALLTENGKLLEQKTRSEMALGKLHTHLEQIQDRIWNSYELTYENALALWKDMPLGTATARAGELRSAIRALGDVNPGSIKEYEEVSQRYGEMKKQYDDLVQAAADLDKLIEGLVRTMEKVFTGEFARVQKEFSQVFTELFGGGQAELRLSDPSDVLGCDIDIIAQPPGKKLQLLSLMSGGERALTAIALLFAMLRIKSPAFCVLDEIEAALDEANVNRFADFLKTYSRETQFILITHRKGSMEACNTLYGVAMEEKGVSSLVSAKFEEVS